ncbi:MAG: ABC transporter substrate-binding protein [Methanomassiliicoccales archaeon]|nr:ABC transporter substrate-binding protein [Methanomassiliicoccales archaeon]
MDKKIAIAAILVVAIVVVAGVIVVFWPKAPSPTNVIYWTQIAPVQQKANLQDGNVQGAVGWEPYCSDSLDDGTASVVAWSADIWPHHPCCVVAVRYSTGFPNNTLDRDLVARVIRAHIDATNWITKTISEGTGANYTMLLNTGASFSARNTTVVASAAAHTEYGYNLTTSVDNFLVNFTEMFKELGQFSDPSSFGGYPTASAFVNATVDTSYLEAAMSVTPSAVNLGTVRLGYLNGDLHQFARVVAMNTTLWGGKTLFDVYGVHITSPAPYPNGPGVMDGFANGNIDMGYLGSPPAILKKINVGTDIKIVALANSEGSAIIATGGITTLAGLVGKTVATPGPGSIQHLLLLWYVEQNGYQLKLVGT